MGRRAQLPSSYEDLITGYYGRRKQLRLQSPLEMLEAVLSPDGRTARVVSASMDDGEVLTQNGTSTRLPEYVVAGPPSSPASGAVVPTGARAVPPSVNAPASPSPPTPLASAVAPPAPRAPTAAPTPSAPPGLMPAMTAPAMAALALKPAADTPAAAAQSLGAVDEHELAADMKAILSGHSVYDAATGRTVSREQVGARPPAAGSPAASRQPERADEPQLPSGNGHAIFDAIAQSMQYANAYDLGTVDLDNRFADFDRLDDLKDQAKLSAPELREAAPVGSPADFLQDIDAIRSGAVGRAHDALQTAADAIGAGFAHATCMQTAVGLAAAVPAPLSRPMYDTGEHVLAADDIYPTPLLVGPAPGVTFTYAQMVTMPDLFESVEQMMGSTAAELGGLKTLIERDTAHYRDYSAPAVSDAEWQTATNDRYLNLAEVNYSHFAPDVLFNDSIAGAGTHHSNHKQVWEAHHRRALHEARAASGDPPAHAIVINAFGDHFLTDAFASGHLINKDAVANYFKHNFLSGGRLTDEAKAFFDRVANRAFVGDVKEKFSRLETAHWPHWYIPFHPNIDSPSRFSALLQAACEQKPDKVANLAVKAIHDRLNADTVVVTNDAGDGEWGLLGDGHLTQQTKEIMQKAVRASVANLTDSALRATDDAACFARVWRFTPRLNDFWRNAVIDLVRVYTDPTSTRLSDTAADLVKADVDQLINVLVKQEKQLRPA